MCGISALTSGVIAFSCGVLIAVFCNVIIIRRQKVAKKRKESEVSKHLLLFLLLSLQQSDQSPQYEEIPLQEPSPGHKPEVMST